MSEPSIRGQNGGNARKEKLSPERRSEIAKEAAKKRWEKKVETSPNAEPFADLPVQESHPIPSEPQEYHCPACTMGQSLEKGEGTHILATVEHPVTLPAESQDTEATVSVPTLPVAPTKPPKRQAKPMPKEFKTASSYAEKRLLQAVKEKADHVGEIEKHTNAIRKLDTEIGELVPIIRALGGKVDAQAGPQLSYPTPSYAPPHPVMPDDPYPNLPAIDPALYNANRGPIPAMSGPIAPPELVPGMPTGGAEDLNYAPGADVRWL